MKTTPLAQLGDWLVTASWLTLLKSRLLLPTHAPEAAQAQQDAGQLRDRLTDATHVQTLAAWLEARPATGVRCVRPRRSGRTCTGTPSQRRSAGPAAGLL